MNENKNKPIPLVIATRNLDKIAEIERHLNGTAYTLRAISQFASASEVIEDGETIEANAIKKAQHAAAHTELMALADDTGLEVDFLNGAPGVFSSRFAGEGASYEDNTNKLLKEMRGVPRAERTAIFRCVIAVACGDSVHTVEGTCNGVITEEPMGKNGFGYDPIFYVPEEGKTFAEMSLEYKNRISHRGKALQKAKVLLGELAAQRE